MSEWRTAGKVRMTPKGTYDPTVVYEILDIVTSSSGTASYVAKKAVPAGTALTNTVYWEPIVNIDEVVDDIESQIESLNRIATGAYSEKSTSGSIAKFDDGADGVPVKALSVAIESQIGVTGATIKRFGKNLLEPFSGSNSYTRGTTVDVQSDGTMRAHGTVTTEGSTWLAPIKTVSIKSCGFAEGDILTISCGPNAAFAVRFVNSGGTQIRQSTSAAYESPVTDTIPAGTVSFTYVYQFGTEKVTLDDVVDITTWFQIERGSHFTGFAAYQSKTREVAFPSEAGSVTAGTLDVTDGVLTVGGSTYSVTPLEIDTLLGANTIFADCGDVTVIYRADPELFLDSNYVKKNDYNNTIEDLNDKDDQVGAKLLALLKKNITDTTENGYLINSMCSYMGFEDILYFYNHKTVDINTGEIKQASEGIPGSVPPMYQISGATDYIDIGTQLIFKISKDLPYNCYCYDTSKQYLGRATVNNTQSAYEIECLTNTKYIRLSFYLPSLDQDQLLKSVQGTLVVINNQKYCYVETTYGE